MLFRKPWKARPKNPAFDGSLDERINARARMGKGALKEEFARLGAAEKIALINRIRRESKSVVIWVDNDATVFFNVPSEGIKPLDFGRRARFKKMYYDDAHANILLKENQTRYYSLGQRRAPVVTSSATGPCIVFLAYRTNEKGEVTAAGVRHSYGAIHDPWRDYGVNIL
ncbi:MAG: hypothetical protein NT067_00550, partial [Candidatus Diapherotrites archaeon]|nr:hypothetical protein [Candidatus Diapherotrites archaeon]